MAQIMLQLACVWLALNDENIKTIRSKCLQSYCYGEVAIVESLLRENIHTCMDYLAEHASVCCRDLDVSGDCYSIESVKTKAWFSYPANLPVT